MGVLRTTQTPPPESARTMAKKVAPTSWTSWGSVAPGPPLPRIAARPSTASTGPKMTTNQPRTVSCAPDVNRPQCALRLRWVRGEAEVLQREATRVSAEAATDLVRSAHLTVRDAGRVLGISHQRVAQLLKAGAGPRGHDLARPVRPPTAKRMDSCGRDGRSWI